MLLSNTADLAADRSTPPKAMRIVFLLGDTTMKLCTVHRAKCEADRDHVVFTACKSLHQEKMNRKWIFRAWFTCEGSEFIRCVHMCAKKEKGKTLSGANMENWKRVNIFLFTCDSRQMIHIVLPIHLDSKMMRIFFPQTVWFYKWFILFCRFI